MNLTELRNKVKTITDYSPELVTYNEQIDLLINDAYEALWTEKRWKFAQKTVFVDIWPDIVATQISGVVAAAGCVNNSRRIIFNGQVHALDLPFVWEGQIFEIDGRDYNVLKVVSNTEIRLDVPFRGTTAPLNVTWKLKHRFYEIPKDAIEMLYIGHRDTPAVGKRPPYSAMRGLLARRDEDLNLREDLTNFWSECYIPVGTANVPAAETFTFVVNAPGSGSFLGDPFIEICWAFEDQGGKLGPLSESKIIHAAAEGLLGVSVRIDFKTFDNQPVDAPVFIPTIDQVVNQFEGMRKRLFFNQNFNRVTGVRQAGLPVWRDVVLQDTVVYPAIPGYTSDADPVRVPDEQDFYIILNPNQLAVGGKRYQDWEGLYSRFRPYPRPIGSDFQYQFLLGVPTLEQNVNSGEERLFRQWECRYYRKPGRLALQTDQPELPHEFHNLIVYKALHDIFSKHDNFTQAQVYQLKYNKELTRLEKRYVDAIDINVQRGQFGIFGNTWSPYDANSLRRMN